MKQPRHVEQHRRRDDVAEYACQHGEPPPAGGDSDHDHRGGRGGEKQMLRGPTAAVAEHFSSFEAFAAQPSTATKACRASAGASWPGNRCCSG